MPRSHPASSLLLAPALALLLAACAAPSESAPLTARSDRSEFTASNAKLVDVPFRYSLSDRPAWQRELFLALEEAAAALDEAYWLQQHADAPRWYRESARNQDLERLFTYGGPWDRLDGGRPLLPEYGPRSPGRDFYPHDLTKQELEAHLAAHPGDREAFLSPYTVVRRKGPELIAVPYHEAFAEPVRRAAEAFRRAASAADDQDRELAAWLGGKALALESDSYFDNDVAWVKLGTPAIEVIAGPHEVYEDELWGVKASYQMVVGLVDPETTARLASYAALAPQMEPLLPWPGAAASSGRPITARLVALHDALRSGDALHSGYTFVATNLPNDPKVQENHGTRKLFFMTAMRARVEAIVRPVAAELLDPSQLPDVTAEGYLHGTALHEIAHALGPRTVVQEGRRVPINEALRDRHGALEECKATVAGFTTLPLLVEHGLVTPELQRQIFTTELAGIFRDVRLGEAHADASTIELNWYLEHGAVTVAENGRWHARIEEWPEAAQGARRGDPRDPGRGGLRGRRQVHRALRPLRRSHPCRRRARPGVAHRGVPRARRALN